MDIKKSNRDSNRRIENGRMIYYQQTASQGFWEDILVQECPPGLLQVFSGWQVVRF